MSILRPLLFLMTTLLAAGLAACSGGGGSAASGSTAQLRFVQGNPSLQSLDYQIDSGGAIYVNAKPGTVQPYQNVAAGTHTIYFYESGTTGSTNNRLSTSCPTPSFIAGTHYTLVLVQTGTGFSSTTPCVFYTEPTVSPASGQAAIVWHNTAGNSTVPASLYPIYCTPAATLPCTSPTSPPGGPLANGAAGSSPASLTTTAVYATAPGVAFTVSNSAGGTPLCANLASDPTLLPSAVDPSDGGNLVPNSTNDTVISIFITDSANTTGANACPVTIAGQLGV